MSEPTSQGMTRREVIKKGAILGGTVMWVTPVVQTVGMSRALAQEPSDTCIEQFADSVVSFSQGTQKGGGAIPADRSDPTNALGAADSDFVSLGYPSGELVVRFASPAFTHTGSQVVVIETTFGTWPPETASVEVSPNGTDWHLLGSATNSPNTTTFDLSAVPFTFIQYVRLTNTTDPAPHSDIDDGFDVNAVGVACTTDVV